MRASIIVPFHRNLDQLRRSIAAARHAMPNAEIVIAADGAVDDCRPLAREYDSRVIDVNGPSGPAVARNRAAEVARGDLLVFVDADVVAHADALEGLCALLDREPDLSAAFGAYDLTPAEPNFMSQFKNLSHAYVHEVGNRHAATFWAGLGAMRATVFRSVGGFDERFRRPSVEDIDLGYRVTAAGHRIRLDPAFRGTHLKRWTIANSITTDIVARGVPWTQLIHRYKSLTNDLNTSTALRWSVALSYGIVAAALLVIVTPRALVAAVALLAALVAINFRYYAWFRRQRGWWFAIRVVPAHLLHHLCNGVSFVTGTILSMASRRGWQLPGALPPGVAALPLAQAGSRPVSRV